MRRFSPFETTNQRRFLPVSEVDRLHEEHLQRFLDVGLFAGKIKREAKAMAENKQRREDAARLEEHVREDAQQTMMQGNNPSKSPTTLAFDLNVSATPSVSIDTNQSGNAREEA